METNDELGVSDRVVLTMDRGRAFRELVPVTGKVYLELLDENGELKMEQLVDNLVVDAGENHIADRLSASPTGAAMGWIAIGTGSTAVAFGDTALGAETDRNATTSITDSGNVVTYVALWAAGDGTNAALREAGIFNQSSLGGTMLARTVYALIDKQAGDTLTITWTVTIGTAGA
jgi:hypothetical protein